jgi:hypothetical protein
VDAAHEQQFEILQELLLPDAEATAHLRYLGTVVGRHPGHDGQ